MKIETRFSYSFSVNSPPSGLRQRLADFLRLAADRLDGSDTLAVAMHSDPVVSEEARLDVLNKGVEHMRRCLHDAVRAEAEECLMIAAHPHLYPISEDRL